MIPEETYDYWRESDASIPLNVLVKGSGYMSNIIVLGRSKFSRESTGQYVFFGKVSDLSGTEFCVIRPYSISLEDWDSETSFMVKCI